MAQGCAPIPPLTTADHRFDNSAVAQTSAPPAAPAALAPTPQTPVAQAFPVQSVQSGAMNSPPLRNPRLDRQGMLDMYSPG